MRYRRKKSNSGGGGGGGGTMSGFLMIVFACVLMIASLIIFGIAVGQLDTAITDAGAIGATQMPGLADIMPLWGMVLFLLFMGAGLATLAAGSYMAIKAKMGGGWIDSMMLVIMGGVAVIIALIANGLVITQLDTAMLAVNSTANTLTGAYDIMGVFGMIIFLALMGAGTSMIVAAGVSGFKKIRGMF